MKTSSKILAILAISVLFTAGFFVFSFIKPAKAEVCYYPFQYIDKMDQVYNHAVCQNYFQVYYFPVVTDGRKYTITLHSIDGEQMLYASRFKSEVDDLSDLQSWACDDDHCDSSTRVDAKTKIVTFRAPTNEPGYYSWFAVYGKTASKYQIGISNNGVLNFLGNDNLNLSSAPNEPQSTSTSNNFSSVIPKIKWMVSATANDFNFSDTAWAQLSFNDASWQEITVPDRSDWKCEHCYRAYRGTFTLDSARTDLKMLFRSDDGIRVYVNGTYIGAWGAADKNGSGCVNNGGCIYWKEAPEIALSNLRQGQNVISAVVINGGQAGFFDFELKQ